VDLGKAEQGDELVRDLQHWKEQAQQLDSRMKEMLHE
jgi:hypothetical protein